MNKEDLNKLVRSFDPISIMSLSETELINFFGKEFALMQGYSQNNPHHCYDLLEHTVKTVSEIDFDGLSPEEAFELKVAALYHDIGKPVVAFEKNGRTVFYNHAAESKRIAHKLLQSLDIDKSSLMRILFYIEHHDDFISFKSKIEMKEDKNPFIKPITIKTVYLKIQGVQKKAVIDGDYVPSIKDYELLIRLCMADARAQNSVVYQDNVVIDSLELKLSRLTKIKKCILSIENAENERCDLHTHSTFSDGTDTPVQLISKAVAAGLKAIALTDHNTIDGLDKLIDSANEFDIDVLPGVEFSTEYAGHELHILALGIEKNQYSRVSRHLAKAAAAKEESNRKIIRNLQKNNFNVNYRELEEFAPQKNINRAVIAQYLVSKGIICSIEEGFKTILSKSAGYYIPPERPSSIDTVKFINSIGALPVLAHPLLDLTLEELELFLPAAKKVGLYGIESYYSLFTAEQQKTLSLIAHKYGLLVSGGSDYHGDVKPHISIGSGTGFLFVPLSVYLKLVEKLQL